MIKSSYLSSFRERHKSELETREIEKRLLELSSLFELSQQLNSSLNLQHILDNVLLIPMGRMLISRGMALIKNNDYEFTVLNVKGLPKSWLQRKLKFPESIKEPLLINEQSPKKSYFNFFKEGKLILLLPVLFNNELKGLIAFGSKFTGQAFSTDEIDFLFSLCNIAGQAIENALIIEELKKVNRSLDQKIQELNTLFEIGKELNQIFDEQRILKQLSYSLMGQMLVNQFFVVLKKEQQWQIVLRQGSYFPENCCQTILQECDRLATLEAPLLVETSEEFKNFLQYKIHLVVPMVLKNVIGGFIFLGPRFNGQPYQSLQLEFVSTLANIAMISIENARLIQETIEKERMEEELKIARHIQNRLLPSNFPQIPNFDIHGLNIPSKQVGGDYFDILQLNDTEWILTIADVSGKGMPAALLMSNLQAGLHTLYSENYSLNVIAQKLNHLIFKNTSPEHFITFFIMKLNSKDGTFEYVNAGHNPPYVLQNNRQIKELWTGGFLLGIFPEVDYELGKGQLNQGEIIIMYTDGVTECLNADEQEFGEQGLKKFLIHQIKTDSVKELNFQLVEQLKQFAGEAAQSDDITLLSVKRK